MKKILLSLLCVLGLLGTGSLVAFSFFSPQKVEATGLAPPQRITVADELRREIEAVNYRLVASDGSVHTVRLSDLVTDVAVTQEMLRPCRDADFLPGQDRLDLDGYLTIDPARALSAVKPEDAEDIPSADAQLVYDEKIERFMIAPESIGNQLVPHADSVVLDRLRQYDKAGTIDLVKLNCYVMPKIHADNVLLNYEKDARNAIRDLRLRFTVDTVTETLTYRVFGSWLTENRTPTGALNPLRPYSVDEAAVRAYVEKLDQKYTTVGKPRKFMTSTGEQIEITRGDYGWRLDTRTLEKQIKEGLLNGESVTSEMPFLKSGDVMDFDSTNGSYVEISIEKQHLWMYIDGECVLETDVVTGNEGQGHGTRKGIFSLKSKTMYTILAGPGYAVHVKYWMPFDGGIGMHDASWRGVYGGEIYKYNGSHGCVNIPLDAVSFIYEHIDKSMPIIVW